MGKHRKPGTPVTCSSSAHVIVGDGVEGSCAICGALIIVRYMNTYPPTPYVYPLPWWQLTTTGTSTVTPPPIITIN